MVDILNFVKSKLDEVKVPYEFGEWTSTVSYPYFVGSFDETDYSAESDCTTGVFTINGWARGEDCRLVLMMLADRIKRKFGHLSEYVKSDWKWDELNFLFGMAENTSNAFLVCYFNTLSVPTDEDDLFRVQIILNTYQWKGK